MNVIINSRPIQHSTGKKYYYEAGSSKRLDNEFILKLFAKQITGKWEKNEQK